MIKILKQQNGLYYLLILSVILVGGFFDWSAAVLGVLVFGAGIGRTIKTKRYIIVRAKWIWLLLVQELCLVVSLCSAVDRGMAFVGVVRFLPVVGWLLLCMQYSQDEREKAMDAIPHAGCLMIAAGLVGYLIPALKDWLWVAQRLGGFFQYPNTCAMFLLMGLIYLSGKESRAARVQWCVLFWGILLTGSRIVMILFVGVLLYFLVREREKKFLRRLIGVNVLAAVAAGALMVLLTGSYQNLARLATVFSSNSTFWGRLLYWQDALRMMKDAPLGLGYRGYYYLQPVTQSGVYMTLYVHNDLLQSFLDGGWLSGLALGALFICQLRFSRHRLMLAVLFLHSLADFDLQFAAVWFTAILLFDYGTEQRELTEAGTRIWPVCLKGCLGLLCLYFCIPFAAGYVGDYELSLRLYPGYTQMKEELLSYVTDADAALSLADEILEANPYVALAYEVKAQVAYALGDIEEFAEYKEKVLAIERYSIAEYEDYAGCLKEYQAYAAEAEDRDGVNYCSEKYRQIEEMLKELERTTSPLAYKLRDQPVFTLTRKNDKISKNSLRIKIPEAVF